MIRGLKHKNLKSKLFVLLVVTFFACSFAAAFKFTNTVAATGGPVKMLRYGQIGSTFSESTSTYASNLDIITAFYPWLGAIDNIKTYNPNAILLQYTDMAGIDSSMLSDGSNLLQIFMTNGWLLKDGSGNYLIYGANYMWDIGNTYACLTYAGWLEQNVVSHPSLNGILFDNVQSSNDYFYNLGFSPPVDPETGSTWTDAGVCSAIINFINTVKSETSGLIFINGVNNGQAYTYRQSLWTTLLNGASVDGIMSEQLFENAPYSGNQNWVTQSYWQSSLNYIVSLQSWMSSGTKYQITISEDAQPDSSEYSTFLPPGATQQGFMTFQFCSELLAMTYNSPCLYAAEYAFNADNFYQSLFSGSISQTLGTPEGSYSIVSGTNLYMRTFSGGLVFVNPTGNSYSDYIGSGYTNAITGLPVSSTVTVGAETGLVLYGGLSPTPTPTVTPTGGPTPTPTPSAIPTPPPGNNFIVTQTPFQINYNSGQSFVVQNPTTNITFTVTSGVLSGTGDVNASNTGGAFQIVPTTSGTLLITTSGAAAQVYIDGQYANNIAYSFSPGDPLITWFYGGSPIIVTGNGVQYFFRSDIYHTLGLSGNGFDSDYTNTPESVNESFSGIENVNYEFQVNLFSDPAHLTALTTGTMPTITVNGNYSGSDSVNYAIPQTPVTLGYEALEINILEQFGTGSWTTVAQFVSPVLITDSIEASTWTFTLDINQIQNTTANTTQSSFTFGTSQYRSGVSGITFSTPKDSEIQAWRLSRMDIIGWEIASYTDTLGSVFYVLLLLLPSAVLYFRYGHAGTVVFFFALFGGTGGIIMIFFGNALWIAAPTLALLILAFTFLLWRILR